MNIKNLILLFFFSVIFSNCTAFLFENNYRYSSRNSQKRNLEKGKCYAKCYINDKYETYSYQYTTFTGNELEENIDIDIREIVIKPKTTKWIRIKRKNNCSSPNPDDCLIWCLKEVPEITKKIEILIDTTQTNNYELRKINFDEIIERGGYTEWIEVLCESDVTNSIISQIQNSLRENGLYEGEITLKIDASTKSSLLKFQKLNKLPIGKLDFETLDLLGVDLNLDSFESLD